MPATRLQSLMASCSIDSGRKSGFQMDVPGGKGESGGYKASRYSGTTGAFGSLRIASEIA